MKRTLAEGFHYRKFRHSRAPEARVESAHVCMAIVTILAKMNGRYRHQYSFPSQDWIVEKLARWFGVEMSRRSLCRHMNTLQFDFWIQRTRRLEYRKRVGLKLRSTLYHLGPRYYAQTGRGVLAMARGVLGEGSRVPEVSQYLRNFLENLSLAGRLASEILARAPPQTRGSPPQKRGG